MLHLRLVPLLSLVLSILTAAEDAFKTKCLNFGSRIDLPNVTVNFASYVPGGTNLSLADNPPSCDASAQEVLTDTCRVAMAVATSNRSQITLEAWFPRNYTGRFLSTGNGGISGCIQYYDLAYTASLGFATVGANNGHNGTSGEAFYKNPDVVEDFAWRSVYTGVVIGKELTKQFYDESFNKSYYLGCSTGGRQGWKMIQSFPDLFDGVLAGSPAFNFVNLLSWSGRFYPLTGPSNASTFVTPAQWSVVGDLVLDQCDALDGAKDGIIEDPDFCQPNVKSLRCDSNSTNSSICLSNAQLHTVESTYQPLRGVHNEALYPRMQPGVEAEAAYIMYGGQPFPFSTDWYRYVVYNNPDWDPLSFTSKDAEVALAQNPFDIETWNGNLEPFRQAGGKVLTYHGMADPLISSDTSKWYYGRVSETMGLDPSSLDEFYRYFRISGMGHCQGGTGATEIGNGLATLTSLSPEDNVLMALVQWVEDGIPPEYVRGSSVATNGSVEWTRKHCKYPKHNIYFGPGAYTDENAWKCVE
ncbi:putative feruloyl esterase B-2 [Talaromyces proteolyticus]|uniref:Carboxylic ester hydrolase n=1 Tax=Talaromyces proteolyticus TaxID=1131652 RepID=A0AAD4KZS6_9EURO|nr:putative feruloyl esterase B-2 [Talaromyces proteolyticus]KAH8704912.1 putative feruloyl esterase B-2 [Talaromyces proteolyticus]